MIVRDEDAVVGRQGMRRHHAGGAVVTGISMVQRVPAAGRESHRAAPPNSRTRSAMSVRPRPGRACGCARAPVSKPAAVVLHLDGDLLRAVADGDAGGGGMGVFDEVVEQFLDNR